ncbi:MAG TPA: AraC family transcriptional regulator [Thiotrichales bacterium]|nr:AraC family transcriptional regulator [Thiotrichales bacterium]
MKSIFLLPVALLALTIGAGAAAEGEEGTSLEKRIQNLKREVLSLNRDLFILEEELLFPANSQVAVFLSLDVGRFFQLDSVQLKIDDKPVTGYLYTRREGEALRRGGVQRLWVGNLPSGEHELVALFVGKGPHDRDYRRATSITFEKEPGPKYLEIRIRDSEAMMQPEFEIREW